jgi:hypothetical protein
MNVVLYDFPSIQGSCPIPRLSLTFPTMLVHIWQRGAGSTPPSPKLGDKPFLGFPLLLHITLSMELNKTEMQEKYSSESPRWRDHLEYIGVDGRVLKQILEQ